jgi:hypothetical protein
MDNRQCVIAALCDLSAAFDTVDHDILLNILQTSFLITGSALKWFKSFLTGRYQRVVVRDSVSSRRKLLYGVPQGSVLGPVLFNIYTHSLSDVFSACKFNSLSYADDTSGYFAFAVESESSINDAVNKCMGNVKSWMDRHFLKLNQDKTQIIIFSTPPTHQKLTADSISFSHCNGTNTVISLSEQVKYLGVILDKNLTLSSQINNVCSVCYYHLKNISTIRRFISQSDCESLVHAVVTSRLDFCNSLYFSAPKYLLLKLQRVQNAAARLVLKRCKRDSISACLDHLHWLNVEQRIAFKVLITVYKCLHDSSPILLSNLLLPCTSSSRHSANTINISFQQSKYGRRSFSYTAPRLWNCLPLLIRSANSLPVFKSKLKTYLFSSYDSLKIKYCQYANILP